MGNLTYYKGHYVISPRFSINSEAKDSEFLAFEDWPRYTSSGWMTVYPYSHRHFCERTEKVKIQRIQHLGYSS